VAHHNRLCRWVWCLSLLFAFRTPWLHPLAIPTTAAEDTPGQRYLQHQQGIVCNNMTQRFTYVPCTACAARPCRCCAAVLHNQRSLPPPPQLLHYRPTHLSFAILSLADAAHRAPVASRRPHNTRLSHPDRPQPAAGRTVCPWCCIWG
jgi:hypothetical protein